MCNLWWKSNNRTWKHHQVKRQRCSKCVVTSEFILSVGVKSPESYQVKFPWFWSPSPRRQKCYIPGFSVEQKRMKIEQQGSYGWLKQWIPYECHVQFRSGDIVLADKESNSNLFELSSFFTGSNVDSTSKLI